MNLNRSKSRPLRQGVTNAMRRSVSVRSVVALAALLLLLFAASHSTAVLGKSKSPTPTQPKQDEQEIDPDDVISVNTTEVLLPVTVRDRAGLLVTNLTRRDFRIFEDGVQQPLSDLSLRQVPVDVVLIVDA